MRKALKVQRNEKKLFGEVNISFYVYIMDHTDTDTMESYIVIVYACALYTCKFTLLGNLWLTVNAMSAWRGEG